MPEPVLTILGGLTIASGLVLVVLEVRRLRRERQQVEELAELVERKRSAIRQLDGAGHGVQR